jgi:hypothetical protein
MSDHAHNRCRLRSILWSTDSSLRDLRQRGCDSVGRRPVLVARHSTQTPWPASRTAATASISCMGRSILLRSRLSPQQRAMLSARRHWPPSRSRSDRSPLATSSRCLFAVAPRRSRSSSVRQRSCCAIQQSSSRGPRTLRGPVVLGEAGRLQFVVVRAMLRHLGSPRLVAMTLYRATCTCGWPSILYHARTPPSTSAPSTSAR